MLRRMSQADVNLFVFLGYTTKHNRQVMIVIISTKLHFKPRSKKEYYVQEYTYGAYQNK